jgi:hydrogenase maturation protease
MSEKCISFESRSAIFSFGSSPGKLAHPRRKVAGVATSPEPRTPTPEVLASSIPELSHPRREVAGVAPNPELQTPNPASPASTLILSWGNDFRRDDGAGRVAARRLVELGLPDVEVIDFNQLCPEHAELLEGRARVIFLDAYPAAPGQGALLLPLDDPQAITLPRSCFGHAVQPTEIMTLADAVYDARPEAWLAAIPGFDFDLGENLTPATEAGIDHIISRIAKMPHCMNLNGLEGRDRLPGKHEPDFDRFTMQPYSGNESL